MVASNPTDITAARVTGPGIHWEPERPANWPANSYDAPPRCQQWSGPREGDQRGRRHGCMTIVGFMRWAASGPLWLARCQCGAWEDRSQRALDSRAGLRCWRCDRLWRLQNGLVHVPHALARKSEPAKAGQSRPIPASSDRGKPQRASLSTTAVVLSAKSVRRASGMTPRTAMQQALADALARKVR